MPSSNSPDPTLVACRKLMLMVAELHQRGYESLRVCVGLSPSGAYWRCDIGPAAQGSDDVGPPVARYSSSCKAEYYDWGDCADHSPEQLADRFERSFENVLEKCGADDPDYIAWFKGMLQQTEPGGLIYSFADWEMDESVMHVMGQCITKTIPLPPKYR